MVTAEAQKNKNIALVSTISIHAILLVLLFFFVSWEAPNPPLSAGGVELNFGLDPAGFGDIQSLAPPNDSKNTEDALPGAPRSKTNVTPTPIEERIPEPEKKSAPAPAAEDPLTTEAESPVEMKEKKVEKKTEKEVEKPIEKPVEKKAEKPAPPVEKKPEPKVDKRALMDANAGAGGVAGTKKDVPGNNNGDKPGTVGDQGHPQGSLNAKALYGDPGTGGGKGGGNGTGGASYRMTGWVWDFKPKVNDESAEEGKIVFEIKIDEQGELLSVRILEKTVSQAVAEIYKKEVEKLTFSPTSENTKPAPTSTGTVTFIIRSR